MNASLHQPSLTAVAQGLGALEPALLPAAARGLAVGLRRAIALARQKYLSGPRPVVLDALSGRLRGSLDAAVEIGTDHVTGRIITSVPYAPTHEFGLLGHAPIPVKAHRRAVAPKSAPRRKVLAQLTYQHVPAHLRKNFTYAGRPFLAPALAEAGPIILAEIQRALADVTPA